MPGLDRAVLKQKALQIISQFQAIQGVGEGTVSIDDLLGVLPETIPEAISEALRARGPIEVQLDQDGHGRFRNAGASLSTPLGPATINIPVEISGQITYTSGSVCLEFEPSRTVSGKVMSLEIGLERLEISEHHLAVRFPGGFFDREISF